MRNLRVCDAPPRSWRSPPARAARRCATASCADRRAAAAGTHHHLPLHDACIERRGQAVRHQPATAVAAVGGSAAARDTVCIRPPSSHPAARRLTRAGSHPPHPRRTRRLPPTCATPAITLLLATTVALALPGVAGAADPAVEPLAVDTPRRRRRSPAGSCTHPTGDADRAPVAYTRTSAAPPGACGPPSSACAPRLDPARAPPTAASTNHEHTGNPGVVPGARRTTGRRPLLLPGAPARSAAPAQRLGGPGRRARAAARVAAGGRPVRPARAHVPTRAEVLDRRVVIGAAATPTPTSPVGHPFAMYDAKAGAAGDFTGTWQLRPPSTAPSTRAWAGSASMVAARCEPAPGARYRGQQRLRSRRQRRRRRDRAQGRPARPLGVPVVITRLTRPRSARSGH